MPSMKAGTNIDKKRMMNCSVRLESINGLYFPIIHV